MSQSLITNQYLLIDAIQSRRQISSRHFLFSHNPSQFNIFNSRERSFLFKERMTPDCLLHDLLIAKLTAYGFDYDSLILYKATFLKGNQEPKLTRLQCSIVGN